MFDIGFWELALIGIVALLVIGPEQLPSLARTGGKYFGRLNRFVKQVKSDIAEEIHAEDINKIVSQQKKWEQEFIEKQHQINADINNEVEKVSSSDSDKSKKSS